MVPVKASQKMKEASTPHPKTFDGVVKVSKRIPARMELAPELVKEITAEINRYYPRMLLGKEGAREKIIAHHLADEPDKYQIAEAQARAKAKSTTLEDELRPHIDPGKRGYAWVLLSNGVGFYYNTETKELFLGRRDSPKAMAVYAGDAKN